MRNPLARAKTATALRLHVGLAAVAYVPLLLTRPGRVSADTKTYLYLDPSKLLSRAWSMWDPSVGTGTVTHQNIGYLWPQGPFYWLMDTIGLPDWVAQRLWWGSIIFAAGAGVAYLLKTLGWRGPGVTAAVFTYALTPYLLTLVSRLSAILLPFAALPWLVVLAIQTVRHKGWRYPALFALVVASCGSVNATALLLVGLAPILWLVHSVWGAREVPFGTALRAAIKIGVLTVPASLWWMSGLSVQGTNGIDILRYTETAKVVATVSISNEILRGLGYWFFYGTDRLGPWIEPGVAYTQWLPLIALTYAVPLLGVIGAIIARWRHRAYFVLLLIVGMALAVGAYPWDEGPPFARGVQAFQRSDAGLAMRSLPRAVPLVVLSLAVLYGAGVASMARRWPRLNRSAGWAAAAVAVLALPALWLGDFVPDNLQRPEDIPQYWHEAADHIDAESHDTRVLVVPGTDFASYRWGNTVDPVLPGLIDRPSVQRELIPYGSPASANLLNAFDLRLQERTADPDSVAPIARLLRAGDVLVQSDLQYERYNTPRPRNFWDFISHAPGLGDFVAFGERARNLTVPDVQLDDELLFTTPETWEDPPQLATFPVEGAVPIVSAQAATNPLIVAGDGAGLVDAAGAGLIDGTELIRYSASLEDDEIAAALDNGASLLLTDSNRKRGERWSTVRHTRGFTETATGGPRAEDLTDNRLPLFPEAGTDTMTIAERSGDVDAEATSYGNPITFSPEERPILAVDGDPETAWRTAAFTDARGERLDLTLSAPVTTDSIRLTQPINGPATRFITEVELRFDGANPVTVELGEQSRSLPGEVVEFPERTFTEMSIEIVDDTVGYLPRYAGQSSEGFAEVEIMADDAPRNDRLDEAVRLPRDLMDAAGADAIDHPLGIVVTRQRQDAIDPTRNDEEQSLVRLFTLPSARRFSLTGEARLSGRADSRLIDALLGRPHDGTVPWVRSVGDLTGSVATPAAIFDGDESTAWTTVRSRPDNQWVEVVLTETTTVDHVPLTLVADGLHSIPTEVELWVDGKLSHRLAVPEVTEGTMQNDTVDVDLPLDEAVTGSRFRIKITGVREKLTNDWVSDAPIPQPAAIAEIGLPGPKVPALPERFDTGCRSDLLEHNSEPIDVQITGTTADALAGRPLEVRLCGSESLRLEGGELELRSARGLDTGIDIDQLVLRSAAGGDADTSTEPLVATAPAPPRDAGDASDDTDESGDASDESAAATPSIDVVGQGADHFELEVTGAVADEPFWLVLGESYNEGWTATVGGRTLPAPELVDGFANGWLVVPSGESFDVRLEFTPQRRVNVSLWISAAAVLLCAGLALRRPKRAVVAPSAMPEPYSHVLAFRYHGALPTVRQAWIVGACVGLLGEFVAGLGVGLIVGIAAGVGTRHEKFRRWLLIASPVALGLSGLYVLYIQLIHDPDAGFEWPLEMKRVHPLGWLTVLLLVADVVVGRIWQSRSIERQD